MSKKSKDYTLEEILAMNSTAIYNNFTYQLMRSEMRKCGLELDENDRPAGEYLEVSKKVHNKHYADKTPQEYQNELNKWAYEQYQAGKLKAQIVFRVIFDKKCVSRCVYANTYSF